MSAKAETKNVLLAMGEAMIAIFVWAIAIAVGYRLLKLLWANWDLIIPGAFVYWWFIHRKKKR